MALQTREATRTYLPEYVTGVIEFVENSGAATLLDSFECADRGVGGAPRVKAPYTPLAILVALFIAAQHGGPYTLAQMFQTLWFELPECALRRLSLDTLVTPTARARIRAGRKAHEAEYRRLQQHWARLVSGIDWSPFQGLPKRRHTNADLNRHLEQLTAAERDRLARNRERALHVYNALVGAAAGEPAKHYMGDIAFDEVCLASRHKTMGTGTQPQHLHAADPDQTYLVHHTKGHAWFVAFTLVVRMHRLYGREVATLATGISVHSAATGGGSVSAVADALARHVNRGEGPGHRQSRVATCDRGFSGKIGMAALLLSYGYRMCHEYWEKNRPGSHAHYRRTEAGHYLSHGVVLCPGAGELAHTPLIPPSPSDEGYRDKLLAHALTLREIRAHQMQSNGLPVTLRQQARGRPRKDAAPAEPRWRVECHCPADLGLLRCPLRPDSMRLPMATPLVRNPPAGITGLACEQSISSFQATPTDLQYFNTDVVGSHEHLDRFNGARSRNESFHSQAESPFAANLSGAQIQIYGIAAQGLIVALAVAATNLQLEKSMTRRVAGAAGAYPREDRWEYRRQRERAMSAPAT